MAKVEQVATSNFEKDFIFILADIGQKAAEKAYNAASFKNRLGNLRDSYGSAVYRNGVLLEDTIKFGGPQEISKGPNLRRPKLGTTGREALNIWLKKRHYGAKNNEIVLVVVAAMWYANAVEKKGFRVIKEVAYQYIAEQEPRLRKLLKAKGWPEEFARAIGVGRYSKNIDNDV